MVLPHCTWDKFGDLLANSGGRLLGMFDELMSFFSTMNMYSSTKMQISDTKEYQDFLQMYTGKCKTRETVTGNANFHMQRTSFTMMGFTQPHTAMPVIQDKANNAKGFTSRLLWFFPEPVFSKLQDNILSKEEQQLSKQFKRQLVNMLATLYCDGESSYNIVDDGKIKKVTVDRSLFTLSSQAMKKFETIHDEWEIAICKKYLYDVLIGGLYSRGKSHVLRLSVPIHVLFYHLMKQSIMDAEGETQSSELEGTQSLSYPDESLPSTSAPSHKEKEHVHDDEYHVIQHDAIDLVSTCLSQLCELSDKQYVLQQGGLHGTTEPLNHQPIIPQPQGIAKVCKTVVLTPGKLISFSILNSRGLFRRSKDVLGLSSKQLYIKVIEMLESLNIGRMENFLIPSNKTQVYFFVKQEIPTGDDLIPFGKQLALIGLSLKSYSESYDIEDEESAKHEEDYRKRLQGVPPSPMKRQRLDLE